VAAATVAALAVAASAAASAAVAALAGIITVAAAELLSAKVGGYTMGKQSEAAAAGLLAAKVILPQPQRRPRRHCPRYEDPSGNTHTPKPCSKLSRHRPMYLPG
jgi:type IV secretory pathway protease TraF